MTDADDTPARPTKAITRDLVFDAALGTRIRAARVASHMTLNALAAAIGVTHQQVVKYEMGKDRVSASMLGAIAAALNVHPGSFYFGEAPSSSGSLPDLRKAQRVGERVARLHNPDVVQRLMALVDVLVDVQDSGEANGHASDNDS